METLEVVSFDHSMFSLVAGFDSGDEPWQRELSTWLLEESPKEMERGTKVWLYLNSSSEIVGYGSLGTTRWKYPTADSKRTPIALIPAVAIQRRFQGQPSGAPRESRFSSQILRHLILEAKSWPGQPEVLGLYVHPDNHGAIKLYQRFEFEKFHHEYSDPATGVVYISYLRRLEEAR